MTELLSIAKNADLYTRKALSRAVPELHLVQKTPTEHTLISALELENSELRKLVTNGGRPDGFMGSSNVMRALYREIIQNTSNNKHLLIYGEPGTEKDLVAQTLHTHSSAPDRQFIHLQSDSHDDKKLPMTTVTSIISSFRNRSSNPECPITLYVGDIDQLHSLTIKELLGIINKQKTGNNEDTSTIRVIGSTTHPTGKKVRESAPKKELFAKLYPNLIIIPPLRTRGADILLLINHFIKKYSVIHKKQIKSISPAATEYLLNYKWPGNVKELELLVENAVKCSHKQLISEYDFYISLQNKNSRIKNQFEISLDERVLLYERELIIDALKKANGNQARAAIHLKLTKRILQYKIEKYAIEYRKFKISVV
jgi:Nif-specific regulatory protein